MKKSKGPKKPARNPSGQFIRDTEHMLLKLTEAKNQIAANHRANTIAVETAEQSWKSAMDRMVAGLLPNLEAKTIAVLKRDLPVFFTKRLEKTVSDAKNVRVPFWTWIFGGNTEYRKDKLEGTHNALKIQLRSWLENQKPANVFAKYNAIGLMETYRTVTAAQIDLAARKQEVSEQIEKLEAVRKHYTSPKAAPPPKELSEAIARSSAKLRANPSIVLSGRSGRDDFDVIRDVYVPVIVFDSILNHRNEVHHHHDTDIRGGGGSFGGGGANTDYRAPAREDRGGGFEINVPARDNDRSDRGGGFEVNASASTSHDDRGGGFEVSASNSRDSDALGRIS
jgi:hypothetical protein